MTVKPYQVLNSFLLTRKNSAGNLTGRIDGAALQTEGHNQSGEHENET